MKRHILIVYCILLAIYSHAQNDRGFGVTKNSSDSIKRNLALVVGISSYPNINRLLYADDDAYLFSDYLINEKICDKKDVTLLIDSTATKANFFKELRKLLDKSGENDRVFIYFAGHGDVESDIESGFLLTYNCEPNNYPATDAIDISMLEKFVAAFTKKNAKVVLITDACRSGNLAGGMEGASITLTSLSRGFQNVVKILSCQPNQLSQEKKYPGGGHGVFTYHLIDGLSGLADKDNDKFITLRELDRYLDEVADETEQQQVPKTEGDPQTKIARFSEELKLALLARKENTATVASNTPNKKRGIGDSSWINNRYYKNFNEHVRANRLVAPEKNNAFYVITEAEKVKQPADLITELKLELAAILEDEAQKFINKYLRGELPYNNKEVLSQIQTARSYLETVEKMIGKDDIRFNEFHVKKLFFDAYYIYRSKEKQKFPEALTYLEKANDLIRNQAWICNAMGLFYEEVKKADAAVSSYLRATKLAPQWSYPWSNLGTYYWNRNKLVEAEAAYKKALELDSTYGFAWNGLGNVLDDLQRYDEAIEAYHKSIHFNPIDDEPWNGLGNVLDDLQRYDEAEECYRKAISLDTLDALPWNGLGNILSIKENYKESEQAYRKAIQLDSTYYLSWNNLGLLMENTDRLKEAASYYRKSVESNPDYTDAWMNLTDVFRKTYQYEEALKTCKKALELNPGSINLINDLGIIYKNLDRFREAEETFKKGLEKDSMNRYILYNLGLVYQFESRHEEAVDCFIKTVQIEPKDEDNWDRLEESLYRIQDYSKRLYWYEKKWQMTPNDTSLAVLIGELYLKIDNPEKAVAIYKKIMSTDPVEEMFSYYRLAVGYAAWNKPDEALKNLELALQKGYNYFDYIENNPYLDSLRELPRYKELIKKYKN
ncbi:MAG TPA: tetratricopeptide repeat protein [Chitinophagaceae bacterium]|nr:tetratricopeptide repeat protein [Chitinophagaceae bacterium]